MGLRQPRVERESRIDRRQRLRSSRLRRQKAVVAEHRHGVRHAGVRRGVRRVELGRLPERRVGLAQVVGREPMMAALQIGVVRVEVPGLPARQRIGLAEELHA